eukprot:5639695-Karenia_brevis.AAC.1
MGVLFAGFQESRGVSGAKTLHGFYQVISGVDTQGRESVELWCNVSQPYAIVWGRPQFIDVRNVRIVMAEPTVLVCDITLKYLQGRIIVAHAPNATAPQAFLQKWHQNLHKYHEITRPVFMIADMNGRDYYIREDPPP